MKNIFKKQYVDQCILLFCQIKEKYLVVGLEKLMLSGMEIIKHIIISRKLNVKKFLK